ncbi:hypothetical protein LSAT2_006405 [Lamellibrachia satsuma]|nr:hypothetical protein LSAT2_006405 [Lamellibrachia satsuma]
MIGTFTERQRGMREWRTRDAGVENKGCGSGEQGMREWRTGDAGVENKGCGSGEQGMREWRTRDAGVENKGCGIGDGSERGSLSLSKEIEKTLPPFHGVGPVYVAKMRRNTRILSAFLATWMLGIVYYLYHTGDSPSSANQALRLKPEFTSVHLEVDTPTDSRLQWQYFNEKGYIDKTRLQPGQDAYARHKFNQAASDRLASDRSVPDTRHHL